MSMKEIMKGLPTRQLGGVKLLTPEEIQAQIGTQIGGSVTQQFPQFSPTNAYSSYFPIPSASSPIVELEQGIPTTLASQQHASFPAYSNPLRPQRKPMSFDFSGVPDAINPLMASLANIFGPKMQGMDSSALMSGNLGYGQSDYGDIRTFQQGGTKTKKLNYPSTFNINTQKNIDLTYPIYNSDTFEQLNNSVANCTDPEKGCFRAAKSGFDNTVASHFGLPKYNDIMQRMGVKSYEPGTEINMSPAQKASLASTGYLNPYNPKEKGANTLDAWEVGAVITDNGGKQYFPTKDKQTLNVFDAADMAYLKSLNIPIGAEFGFMPDAKTKPYVENNLSFKRGLGNSNHAAISMGWDEEGQPILSDYGNARRMNQALTSTIKSIVVPKEYEGKTFDYYNNLRKTESSLNPNRTYSIPEDIKEKIGYDASEMEPFLDSLSKNRNVISKRLGLSEEKYDELAKRLISITGQETKFGSSVSHNVEDTIAPGGNSLGLGQLNWKNIKDDPQLHKIAMDFGVSKEDDLTNPSKFAIASMLYAWKHDANSKYYAEKGTAPSFRYYSKNDDNVKNLFRDPHFEKNSFLRRDRVRNIVGDETFKMPFRGLRMSDEKYAEKVNAKLKEDAILGPAGVSYQKVVSKSDPNKEEWDIVKPTMGNSPNLTDDQKFFIGWSGYAPLASGDSQLNAQGEANNIYSRRAEEIMKKIIVKQKGGTVGFGMRPEKTKMSKHKK